jgi:ferritin-like metal-binding protein YciE
MGIFSSSHFDSLEDLFVHQLEDLYDAEKRIRDGLVQMAGAAHNPELRQAFETHLAETEGQITRLERVFQQIGREPERETCEAAKGLIREGSEMIKATGDADVKDAGLIAAAQRVEHYEIAGYGTARTLANQLGHTGAAALLQETLEEEGRTDKLLTRIAESGINMRAAREG